MKLKEATINIKLPIEIDEYIRNFILIKKYNKCIIFIDKHMYAIYNINYNLKKGR